MGRRERSTKSRLLREMDWLLIALVVIIVLYGVIAILSATSPGYDSESMTLGSFIASIDWKYAGMQLAFFAIGAVLCVLLVRIDYNNLRDFTNILYWIMVAVLVGVLFMPEVRGVSGWISITSSISIQPAEFCKLILIVVLAKEFAQRTENQDTGISTIKDLLPILWRAAIPVALIMAQPDWGTALVFIFVLVGMMFMAKTSLKVIGILGVGVGACLPILWLLMEPWQRNRFLSFFNPSEYSDELYHATHARVVESSGGLTGKGLFSTDLLTQTSYLPEDHTDFIFSSNTEALGLIGGIVLILLYAALLLRLIFISMNAKDEFGAFVVAGVACMFLMHIFENIGMNIGIMPITGIPLPLFSYGGSSMLTNMMAIGLVLSVYTRRGRHMLAKT